MSGQWISARGGWRGEHHSPGREATLQQLSLKFPARTPTTKPPLVGGTGVLRASLIAHHALTSDHDSQFHHRCPLITLPRGGEFALCPAIYDVEADGGKGGRRVPEVRRRVAPRRISFSGWTRCAATHGDTVRSRSPPASRRGS